MFSGELDVDPVLQMKSDGLGIKMIYPKPLSPWVVELQVWYSLCQPYPCLLPLNKQTEELQRRFFWGSAAHPWESDPWWLGKAKGKTSAKVRPCIAWGYYSPFQPQELWEINGGIHWERKEAWENFTNRRVFVSCWLFQHILGTRSE